MADIGMDCYLAYEDGYKAGYAECERKHKCKPLTNADRICSMTDEELAECLSVDGCCREGACSDVGCEQCWLDWLKQESKE